MQLRSPLLSLITLLLFALTCGAVTPSRSKKNDKEFVVVIDPGHGGRDYGAVGAITNEKTINLNVAKEVRDILAEEAPEIKVVMTRHDDTFVSLAGRASIANKAGGDLFVSIHTNSVDKSNPRRSVIAGASVYTLGLGRTNENLEVAMRENAVMTLEPDYTTTYKGFDPKSAESYIIFEMDRDLHMEQSISAALSVQDGLIDIAGRNDHGVRQAGFLVLRATSMPAILVELDFICNPAQEKYMASEQGRKKLGRAVATGIMSYSDDVARARAQLEGTPPPAKRIANKNKKRNSVAAPAVAGNDSELSESGDSVFYRIQFMTLQKPLNKDDKRLANLPEPVRYYRHGGMVKYVCGRFVTEAEAAAALIEVKRRYSDAFIIRTRGASRL